MLEIFYAFIFSLSICIIIAPVLIPSLRRLKFGQMIRNDGPKRHLKKQGTPTMGGLMFIFSLLLTSIFFAKGNIEINTLLFFTIGFGFVGFLDDFLKIYNKRSLGLTAREKLLMQLLLSVFLVFTVLKFFNLETSLLIPGFGYKLPLSVLYIPVIIFVILGTTNAVNLTDGLDGLAAGVTFFVACFYIVITWQQEMIGACIFSAALAGSCLGFFLFNKYPAKVFMGDTGSLALGGAIVTLAIITKTELFLPIIGLIYVSETLSVMIQVISFKYRKKRVFLMTPIHHHFELKGWSEKKIVLVFWAITIICVLMGLALYFMTF